mgnify:CR=1 FL=1
MGFLKRQSIRLMRESWHDANELAEEMRAIFNSEEPIVFDQPITINNNTGEPAITINNGGNGPTIEINNNPTPPIQFPDYPPITIPDFPEIPPTIIYNNDGTIVDGDGEPVDQGGTVSGGGGGGFPGLVVSGSGDLYEVDVYERGTGEPPTRRFVRIMQIDEDATIPAGTGLLVARVTNGSNVFEYYSQVAVWL